MSFSAIIHKKYKVLLPFSFLYLIGIKIHHLLYSLGLKKRYRSKIPTICVGNLSVGGTGKTPMVEKIVSFLKDDYQLGIVSRGYRRKSKGLVIANENTSVEDLGDEPFQYFTKFKNVQVAVAEKRVAALQYFESKNNVALIILDDAFQHLAVNAGFSILLTKFENPFYSDYYLPAGELRDLKKNYTKAQIIVVTKCPQSLSLTEAHFILKQIKPLANQKVYFAALDYAPLQPLFQSKNKIEGNKIIVVTGIANPKPIMDYLQKEYEIIKHFNYSDHHHFSIIDIEEIKKISSENCMIVTTEKDATKLIQFKNQLQNTIVCVLPVTHKILFDEEKSFFSKIKYYIDDCN